MKRNAQVLLILIVAFLVIFSISGCSIFNKVPEKYTEGVKIARDYPDDILLIYDDSIVFECDTHFREIVLSCGTKDDFDDIVDFYKEFFKENDITLDDEDKDRDEYYAKGINDGYLIKLEVIEAEGEYIEDLFENVIYLSVEEIGEASVESIEPTQEPIQEDNNDKEKEDNQSPSLDEKSVDETPITEILTGSWTLIDSSGDPGMHSTDFNLEIIDDANGTLYYFNKTTDINAWADFTYTISDGKLLIEQNGNNFLRFDAYYDDFVLHLKNIDVPTEEYYLVHFNDTYNIHPSTDIFTAYGCWIYYNPETSYIDSISFWTDKDGYMYNIFGQYNERPLEYEYTDGNIVFWFDTEETFCFGALHNGNILELTDQEGHIYPYNRVETSWLTGTYSLIYSSDESIESWIITFNTDHSASFSLISDGEKHEVPDSEWYIDPKDGKLYILNDGQFYGFYYHFNGTGMIIYDPDNDITLELIKTR
jgi:hypothetical protein